MARNKHPKMSRAQATLAREIRFAYVEATRDYLSERAGTTPSGATYSLRVMEGNGWVRESMSGNWSLTRAGDEAFDAYESKREPAAA